MHVHVHAYMHGCTYMCMCMCMCMCIYTYVYVCVYTCIYLCISCMCCLFHLALGNEDGGVQIVYESVCCLACGLIFDRRKDRGVVCVFFILNAGGSVRGCVCVYTHTHTYTAQMGSLDVSPARSCAISLSDGLNLGMHIFVYVYKVHMCIYMLRGGVRSWTNCFFLLTFLFSSEK